MSYEPVWFDSSDKELPPLLITARDKKKFYEKGDGWKECEPRDFEVVEGEIVKAQRRIRGEWGEKAFR